VGHPEPQRHSSPPIATGTATASPEPFDPLQATL